MFSSFLSVDSLLFSKPKMSVVLCFVYFVPVTSLLEESSLHSNLSPWSPLSLETVKAIDNPYKLHRFYPYVLVLSILITTKLLRPLNSNWPLLSSKFAPGKYVNMKIDNVCFKDCK